MSKHTTGIIRIIICTALLVLVFRAAPAPAESEDDPTISLVKTLIVREYKGVKIDADEYRVKPGDSLARILRERQIAKPGPLPANILNLIKFLNPDLENPNVILPDQVLILPVGPVDGLPEENFPEPAAETAEPEQAQPADTPQREPAAAEAAKPEGSGPPPKIEVTEHVVQAGESLAQLLRNIGLPDSMIFNEYLELTLALNPHLKNPNIIYANQRIKLPMPGAWAESALAAELKKQRASVLTSAPAPPITRTQAPAQLPRKEDKPAITVPTPQLPPANTLAVRTALGLVFSRIGERFISTGQHFLPLKSGGQITINTQAFPIIEMRNGLRLLLDLDRRLPEEMVALIRTNWSNYAIFRPSPGESLSAMLARLFEMGRYYKMHTAGTVWTLHRDVDVTLSADWIIWPTQEDWAAGRAVVITLPESRDQGTLPAVAAYLAKQGVKVIDFYPRGNLIGPDLVRETPDREIQIEELNPIDTKRFILDLLDLVGQKYEQDLNIPLVTNGGQDFNLTIQVPVYFARAGEKFVLSLQPLPESMTKLLTEHNFSLITRTKGEKPAEFAARLLKELGIRFDKGLKISASTRPSGRNLEVDFPGLLLDLGLRQVLLTPVAVPFELAGVLNKPNLKVVRYDISNPD